MNASFTRFIEDAIGCYAGERIANFDVVVPAHNYDLTMKCFADINKGFGGNALANMCGASSNAQIAMQQFIAQGNFLTLWNKIIQSLSVAMHTKSLQRIHIPINDMGFWHFIDTEVHQQPLFDVQFLESEIENFEIPLHHC